VGLWSRIKARLGFGDYEYDDYYDEEDDTEDEPRPPAEAYTSPYGMRSGGVRRVERLSEFDRDTEWDRGARHPGVTSVDTATPRVSPQVKMHIVEPRSFTEAQGIADRYKKGTPVIMNMTGTAPELGRRFIDFASGLTYGLNGGLQKVSDKVFMLTPENVDVSEGDVKRMRDKGVFGGIDA